MGRFCNAPIDVSFVVHLEVLWLDLHHGPLATSLFVRNFFTSGLTSPPLAFSAQAFFLPCLGKMGCATLTPP